MVDDKVEHKESIGNVETVEAIETAEVVENVKTVKTLKPNPLKEQRKSRNRKRNAIKYELDCNDIDMDVAEFVSISLYG